MTDSLITTELVAPGPELLARKDDLWRILEKTDKDFVPPLSNRTPTTLGAVRESRLIFPLPIEHLDFQLGLHVIFATLGDEKVGFLSFMPDFAHEAAGESQSLVLIDTVAIVPSARRKGIARELYRVLFATPLFAQHEEAILHTWSTNKAHNALIKPLGFEEYRRMTNERSPGVDTVIYRRVTKPSPFVS